MRKELKKLQECLADENPPTPFNKGGIRGDLRVKINTAGRKEK